MERKKVTMWFVIGAIVIAAALALRLLRMRQPPSQVLVSVGIVLIFLIIPILGANRSLKKKETETRLELKQGRLSAIRIVILFVVSPLLCGLIGYLTYPSTSLALPFVIIVMVAASLFYFVTRQG
jgi:uncharacterized membrane protein